MDAIPTHAKPAKRLCARSAMTNIRVIKIPYSKNSTEDAINPPSSANTAKMKSLQACCQQHSVEEPVLEKKQFL